MADAMLSSANFRQAAMDLALRLSSLQHYVSAARELIARCEQLQPRDVNRHSRKVDPFFCRYLLVIFHAYTLHRS